MLLRKKTQVIIGITLVGLIAVLYIALRIVLLERFIKLEEEDTRQNVGGVLNALSNELSDLDTVTFDWSVRDEPLVFIEDAGQEDAPSSLVDDMFVDLQLNLMLFIDLSGQMVFGKGFDLQKREQVPVPSSLWEHLAADSLLLSHPDPGSSVTGILLIPEGPLLIASRLILPVGGEEAIRGTLVMGRYLDATAVERLTQVPNSSLTLIQFDDPQMPSDFQAVRPLLSDEESIPVQSLSASRIAGYALLKDVYGQPALILRMGLPREIYQQSQVSLVYFLALFATILVFGGVILLLFEGTVLSRLTLLSTSVSRIGAEGNLQARVSLTGEDELANLANDINKMLAALERSQMELSQRLLEQETLFAIGQLVSSSLQIDEVLQRVAEQMTRLVDAAGCAISDWDPEAGILTVQVEYIRPDTVERGNLVKGVVKTYDVSEYPAMATALRDCSPFVAYVDDPETGSQERQLLQPYNWYGVAGVPLVVQDRVIGLAQVYLYHSDRRFDGHDLQLLQALTNQVAVAIDNARLFTTVQANEAAMRDLSLRLLDVQEQERRYIARELHDELGQLLTATKINIDLARRRLSRQTGRWDEDGITSMQSRLDEAADLTDKVLTNVRAITVELRPTLLDDMGIVPTLRWYLGRFATRTGIQVQLEACEPTARLQPETETTLYRVVQEALTNVARHAQASQVQVELVCSDDVVSASVEDDGQGFDVGTWLERPSEQQTLGLAGIRERTMLLGGRVEINSQPHKGTRIEIELPARFRSESE